MTHALSIQNLISGAFSLLEHTAVVVLGLVMMIVGLGLGVTVIMLPAGMFIGLLGVAMVISGLFVQFGKAGR